MREAGAVPQQRPQSPTAEQVFSARAATGVPSADLNPRRWPPCTLELLEWAEVVFVMEKARKAKLSRRFGRHLRSARVVCLDIPDRYGFVDPTLAELLRAGVARHPP